MPAAIQRLNIIGIEGFAALALQLKQLNTSVAGRVIVPEAAEITPGKAGVVELAYLSRRFFQRCAVARQCVHAGLPGRLPAGGGEGVDVAHLFISGPAHFIAENPHETVICHLCGSLLARRPFGADLGSIPGDAAAIGVVKRVTVVGYGKEVQPLHP